MTPDKSINAHWFLEVEGHRSGPYTREQIKGLFDEKEVLVHHRVCGDLAAGVWISVNEFLSPTSPDFDSAVSLFDALQSIRDKQPDRFIPPSQNLNQKKKFKLSRKKKKGGAAGSEALSEDASQDGSSTREFSPEQVSLILRICIALLILSGVIYAFPKFFNKANQDLDKKAQAKIDALSVPAPAASVAPVPVAPHTDPVIAETNRPINANPALVPPPQPPARARERESQERRETYREKDREKDREKEDEDRTQDPNQEGKDEFADPESLREEGGAALEEGSQERKPRTAKSGTPSSQQQNDDPANGADYPAGDAPPR